MKVSISQFLNKRFFMNENTYMQTEWKAPSPLLTHPILSKGKKMPDGGYQLFVRKGDTLDKFIDRLYGKGKRCELTPFLYIQLVNLVVTNRFCGNITLYLEHNNKAITKFCDPIMYVTRSEKSSVISDIPELIRGVWLCCVSDELYLGLSRECPAVLKIEDWINELEKNTSWWLEETCGCSDYDGRIRIQSEFLCGLYHYGTNKWCIEYFWEPESTEKEGMSFNKKDLTSKIIENLKKQHYPPSSKSWGIAMNITPEFDAKRVIHNELLYSTMLKSFKTFKIIENDENDESTRAQLIIRYDNEISGWLFEYQVINDSTLDDRYSLTVRSNMNDKGMHCFICTELETDTGYFYDVAGADIVKNYFN